MNAAGVRGGLGWKIATVRLLFLLAAVAATSPAWRPLVFGISPTLDDLLRLRCFDPELPK